MEEKQKEPTPSQESLEKISKYRLSDKDGWKLTRREAALDLDAHVAERTAFVANARQYWLDKYYEIHAENEALRAAADAMAEAGKHLNESYGGDVFDQHEVDEAWASLDAALAAYRALSPVGEGETK